MAKTLSLLSCFNRHCYVLKYKPKRSRDVTKSGKTRKHSPAMMYNVRAKLIRFWLNARELRIIPQVGVCTDL